MTGPTPDMGPACVDTCVDGTCEYTLGEMEKPPMCMGGVSLTPNNAKVHCGYEAPVIGDVSNGAQTGRGRTSPSATSVRQPKPRTRPRASDLRLGTFP